MVGEFEVAEIVTSYMADGRAVDENLTMATFREKAPAAQ
jgi:hypothetical protein